MLDVTGFGCLHGGVNESLSTGHGMEEEIRGVNPPKYEFSIIRRPQD